jgi:predicted SnoaL-like aldol condensation-catalyzing enzyme
MKTTKITLSAALLGLSLSLGLPLFAQEPVVGVANPEAPFMNGEGSREERRNKEAALHIMRELLQCNQWDRADEWLTEQYIQHNPNAESGRDGVVYYFTQVLGRKPTATCGKLTTPIVAVMAQDDLVTVITPREYDDPRNPGQKYYTTWFDTWRFVDGKADEHWDPATIAAP